MNNQDTIYDVLGIGNALVDVFGKVSDRFLSERNLKKSAMTLVDAKTAGMIYNDMIVEREMSGGSVANTIVGLASLGHDCAFIGKVYQDNLGQSFKRDMGAFGIDYKTPMLLQGPASGRSIVLVTPDAMRSMFTYLGAAQRLNEDDVDADMIKSAKYIFLEGYLFDVEMAKKALFKAADLAHYFNRNVVFTLSETGNMQADKAEIAGFIKDKVDILFANEREIKNLYETDDLNKIIATLQAQNKIASITLGSKGAIVTDKMQTVYVDAQKIEEVVDTTGAGDLYASGFIHALLQGQNLKKCAMTGCIVASEIVTHYGARAESALKSLLREKVRGDI